MDVSKTKKNIRRGLIVGKIIFIIAIPFLIVAILVGALKIIFGIDVDGGGNGTAKMPAAAQEILSSAGVSTYTSSKSTGSSAGTNTKRIQSYEDSGDGYSSVTTVGDKKYRNYKQYDGSYAENSYWDGDISSDGCGPSSVAIILSGYGLDYSPGDVAGLIHKNENYSSSEILAKYLKNTYSIDCERKSDNSMAEKKEDILNNLQAGRPVIVGVNGTSDGVYSKSGHWMTIIGINESGNIITSNPGRSDSATPTDDTLDNFLDLQMNEGSGYILIKTDKVKETTGTSSTSKGTTGKSGTSKGTTGTSGITGSNEDQIAQRIIKAAQECHKYVREKGYTYGGGYSIPEGIYSHNIVDCSAYVSWVYYCAGYESFKGPQETDIVENAISKHGLVEIPLSEVKPGDIIHEPGHVEIVAEVVDGTITRVYNCGSDESIQSEGTPEVPESSPDYGGVDHAYRAASLGTGSGDNKLPSSSDSNIKVESASSTNISGHVKENGRGGYKANIDLKAEVKKLIEKFDEENVDVLKRHLKIENREEYLQSFLNAALVTSYPDLRSASEIESGAKIPEGEVQGIIKVRRKTIDTNEGDAGKFLSYIPYDKYTQMKDSQDNNIFNYFTIGTDGQMIVAGYEKRTVQPQEVDDGGDPVPDNIQDSSLESMYKITDSKINYVGLVEKYSMPFDLLWALLVYTGNEDFVHELAELVAKGEIIITVCDNITTKDVTDVYTYKKNVKSKETVTFTDTTEDPGKLEKKYTGDRPDESYQYTQTNKYIYETNTPSIAITYADSWTMKYEAKVKKSSSDKTEVAKTKEDDEKKYVNSGTKTEQANSSDSVFNGFKVDFEKKLDEVYNNNNNNNNANNETSNKQANNTSNKNSTKSKKKKTTYKVSPVKIDYTAKRTNKGREVTTNTKETKFVVQTGKTEEKTDVEENEDNFVKLLSKYPRAKYMLKIYKGWFFDSVEKMETLCDMEDMLKYLLQKALGINLGVDTFDFEEYGKNTMQSVGSLGTSSIIQWICSWENPWLYEYMYEDGEYSPDLVAPYVTQDKKYYIARSDLGSSFSYNRNFGFGICYYHGGNWANVEYFKKYGIDIQDSKYQVEGAQLETEIVDKVRDEGINEKMENIKSKALKEGVTLDDAQVAALIDISYQYGNYGNFFDFYKSVGQDRKNEKIRDMQCWNNDGELAAHPFDLNAPDAQGERNKSRWKLFSEGICIASSGKEINLSATGSDGSYAGEISYETSTTGEYGYTNIVTEPKSGRKYKVYAQSKFSGNIPSAGCSISSEAIVLSGYRTDLNYTPENTAERCGYAFPRTLQQIASDLTSLNVPSTAYNINPEINQEISEEIKQQAISNISNNLKQGKPVIILVTDSRTFGTKYTTCAHYMALIGFNNQGKPVIADPACGGKVWEEDTLEDIVKYNIYEPTPSGAERGYVLVN